MRSSPLNARRWILLAAALVILGGAGQLHAAPPAPTGERAPVKPAQPAAIEAPQLERKFIEQGLRILVDRRPQQLRLEAEKPEAWLGDSVRGNQAVEVAVATSLRKESQIVARLAAGRKLYITKVEGAWAGATFLVGGRPQAGWVKVADLKPLPSEERAYRHLQNAGGKFISAAMLAQKAKQFDDGLYAAVELAANEGLGEMPAKSQLLRAWPTRVSSESSSQALAVLLAAAKLGNLKPAIPPSQAKQVADLLARFESDEKRSKPLGFYTWSPELSAIFRQDRMLQTPIDELADVLPLAKALAADEALRRAYLQHLLLSYRLTNPPMQGGSSDLRPLIAGDEPPPAGIVAWHIFPPSTSPETQLFLRLFGDKPVPEGFELMQALIDEIRSGRVDLKPTEISGWYDHQIWSLAPLLMPERTPEASHLVVGDEYRKHLEDLFKGTMALMRETHVKQLAMPAPGSAAEPPERKPELVIRPDLSVEPLAMHYLRRAQAYAFVQQVLIEAFGPEGLAKMHRLAADGPVETTLDHELGDLAVLFYGAHVVASRQLGLSEQVIAAGGSPDLPSQAAAAFLQWAGIAGSDPDLARDARMMVPVFVDQVTGRIKVWCVLGWSSQTAWASYSKQPQVSATDAKGKAVDLAARFEMIYGTQTLDLAAPVFAEAWVTKLLDRDEFRRHCDTYVTPAVILANLK
ncbi:MAG: hypothetical protein WD872_04245 [Pirellulaceae bacterium]